MKDAKTTYRGYDNDSVGDEDVGRRYKGLCDGLYNVGHQPEAAMDRFLAEDRDFLDVRRHDGRC